MNKGNIFQRGDLAPKTSFLKITIYGEQGAGKSYTAAKIARGIHMQMKKEGAEAGPVCMVDSETGAAKLYPLFEAGKVPFLPIGTESYDDLVQAVKDAEAMKACALIVDSVTHFSDDLKRAYMHHHRKAFVQVWDYGPLGELWLPWTKLFINSKLNIIACGRLAWDYSVVETQDGDKVKKEVVRDQAKFRSLGKFGYEGDILLEMELFQNRDNIDRNDTGPISFRRAFVMKDRWGQIEGKIFDNPGFEDMILPIWKQLAPAGEHHGVEQRSTHANLPSDSQHVEDRRRGRAAIQEIDGDLALFFPGQTEAQRLARTCIPFYVLGTHSRDEIEAMPVAKLSEASKVIKVICKRIVEGGVELTRDNLMRWVPDAVNDAKDAMYREPEIVAQEGQAEAEDPSNPFWQGEEKKPEQLSTPTPSPSPSPELVLTPPPVDYAAKYQWLASLAAQYAQSDKCKKAFADIKKRRRLLISLTLDTLLNRAEPTQEDADVLKELLDAIGETEKVTA